MLSRDCEKLARVCNAILLIDPSEDTSNQALSDLVRRKMKEIIESRRANKDWKALQVILRDLMEAGRGLPHAARAKVQRFLISEGIGESGTVDDERVRRVLRTREIRTASEFKAVESYLDSAAPEDKPKESIKILAELASIYLAARIPKK